MRAPHPSRFSLELGVAVLVAMSISVACSKATPPGGGQPRTQPDTHADTPGPGQPIPAGDTAMTAGTTASTGSAISIYGFRLGAPYADALRAASQLTLTEDTPESH